MAAAQRYGSYVSALGSIGGDIKATQSSGTNFQVGNATYDNSSSGEDMIHAIIKEMYANSKQHAYEDAAGKLYLNRRNLELGAQLAQYGITAVRGSDGVWYVDRVGGQLLYDKYRKYTYHEGGIVGGGDIKSNEQLSLLKTKEWVLSEQMVDNLTTQMDRINMLSDAMSDLPDYAGKSTLSDVMKQVGGSKTVNSYPFAKTYQISGGTAVRFYNDSTCMEKLRPEMLVTLAAGCTSFAVKNKTTGAEMRFDNLPGSSLSIRVDNENQVVTEEVSGYDLYEHFNFVFLELEPGDNELVFTGTGSVTISGRYLYNVGA